MYRFVAVDKSTIQVIINTYNDIEVAAESEEDVIVQWVPGLVYFGCQVMKVERYMRKNVENGNKNNNNNNNK